MKISLRSLLIIAGLTAALNASAAGADCCKDKEKSACCGAGQACCETRASTAPAAAPDTCVVSGEKLGEMGKPYAHVHQQDGQPDRTVLFCCKGCVKDFQKDPAKYLQRLDEAAKARG